MNLSLANLYENINPIHPFGQNHTYIHLVSNRHLLFGLGNSNMVCNYHMILLSTLHHKCKNYCQHCFLNRYHAHKKDLKDLMNIRTWQRFMSQSTTAFLLNGLFKKNCTQIYPAIVLPDMFFTKPSEHSGRDSPAILISL